MLLLQGLLRVEPSTDLMTPGTGESQQRAEVLPPVFCCAVRVCALKAACFQAGKQRFNAPALRIVRPRLRFVRRRDQKQKFTCWQPTATQVVTAAPHLTGSCKAQRRRHRRAAKAFTPCELPATRCQLQVFFAAKLKRQVVCRPPFQPRFPAEVAVRHQRGALFFGKSREKKCAP